YDKLSFVLYSQGRVMGIDPGTQLYGLPLHQQWDSMTIAHNTISVDAQRQSAGTGKLIDWHTGANWVAVTLDGGPVYKDVSLRRSILLTPNYCLIADRVHSSTSHTVDWIYHNVGALTIERPQTSERLADLPSQNGYGHLSDVKRSSAGGELRARFVDAPNRQPEDDSNPNSPAVTTRPADAAGIEGPNTVLDPAVIELVMPASDHPEFMAGVAPGHDLKNPVPFVLARKLGDDVSFTAVLSPMSTIEVSGRDDYSDHELDIAGPDFSDHVSIGPTLSLSGDTSSER
ncbi:MAG TPA: heparinase II/III family protein, partial [Candidatus Sulfotelmatobacter sp.]|nr:heparinase II/III family protein [Candidatus Sulfotelmatobacter sp.]